MRRMLWFVAMYAIGLGAITVVALLIRAALPY
ncbi:DUF2474 domain-containing protein [Pseudooceanicola sediminis]|uniref:DUF2474 domain-containing protein n=1 Tax=Pseudooceanicola sediminis TaxID=2211117 RepID=A0A399J485_9RHOB|nr:DUF2474 domain-containing protein [Pseudooceanicola sediminis]KAA2315657.1 DUF2474 domain-containing protein [Puniceibacterium sp. HSS470]RII40144.1 DUF2474 domain-containing protein [Pseudooceanicola sediminis]